MSILFANTRGNHGTSSGHLIEFKAGRTMLEPGSSPEKRKAVADKTRGLAFIKQSPDQLLHFCWKNREKNTTDLDLIVFPGDTEFVRIKECTDGRTYMLKFGSCEDHKLFWLQDANSDKDEELVKKINELLNNPPSARASARGGASERSATSALSQLGQAVGGADDIGALGNMDQQQIMQLFSLMNGGNAEHILPQLPLRGSTQAVSASANTQETPKVSRKPEEPSAPARPVVNAESLNQILNKLTDSRRTQVDLNQVLTRSEVESVARQNAAQLTPHLPSTSLAPSDELQTTLRSPQFQQAVNFIGSALQSGQLGPALRHFDLPDSVAKAADTGDIAKFGEELTRSQQADVDQQINEAANQEENAESGAKQHKDEDMELD